MFRPRTAHTSIGVPKTALPVTAYPKTSSGSVVPTNLNQIPEGRYTETIYTLIRDRKFKQVIKLLTSHVLLNNPETYSRAGLSLLGFCYYMTEDYVNSSKCYEILSKKVPENEEYKLYHAQSLYKLNQFVQAEKMLNRIEAQEYSSQIHRLHACITYFMNDLSACRLLIEGMPAEAPDTLADSASEGKLQEALDTYLKAYQISGYDAHICYCVALCYYQQKSYVQALKFIGDIVEKGINDYPELNVGMATEGVDVRSVGNSQSLQDSYLVEAFNLKAAIEYQLKNGEGAKEALSDMPPRDEEELDSVTLHNQALIHADKNPLDGFEKLGFLLETHQPPPETLSNLLVLYLKHNNFDLAADYLAQHRTSAEMTMSVSTLEFLDAVLLKGVSPDDAFKKLDDIGNTFIESLRMIAKQVQDARQDNNQNPAKIKQLVGEYEANIEGYMPVLMQQAKIYWDLGQYEMVEKLFRKSVEFCNENDTWRLNVAHTLYMQEKYKEAISFYEPLVRKQFEDILSVQAIILANLCVSFIMTSQNAEAEDLMRHIEKEEENLATKERMDKHVYHLCIVNLVIGTLYCSKSNYEFGISRIIKSMEPFEKKLGTDTWFYAKRCLVALFEHLSRHLIQLKDSIYNDILKFLDDCDHFGRSIPCDQLQNEPRTVSQESRTIKALYLSLYD